MGEKRKPPEELEPQSYGSGEGWSEGRTSQTVQQTPSRTSRHDEPFYEERFGEASVVSHHTRRGTASPGAEIPETALDPCAVEDVGAGGKKLPETSHGRKSYFRDRDYR